MHFHDADSVKTLLDSRESKTSTARLPTNVTGKDRVKQFCAISCRFPAKKKSTENSHQNRTFLAATIGGVGGWVGAGVMWKINSLCEKKSRDNQTHGLPMTNVSINMTNKSRENNV